MKNDKPEYADLRRMVEEVTACKMQTPKDFDLLALRIYDRTKVFLSVSTLKRFWGYVGKNDEKKGEMRRSSLNALAVYVGFSDWDAFCHRSDDEVGDGGSNFFYGCKQLLAESLTPGDELMVIWRPNRCITIRYSGSNVFVVLANENSKLSVGDTFKCHLFVENQPLTLVDLVHDGMPPCGYVCGKNGGVTFARK